MLDRVSKYWVYHHLSDSYELSSFLSFSLTFNRGIAWGIFNYENAYVFVSVSVVTMTLCAFFAGYTMYRSMLKASIVPETFILAGGLSNILDRFVYHGVVDFIVLHLGAWSWPAFNIADAAIVFGILWIGVTCVLE